MLKPRLAILGATGLVGRKMIQILQEEHFPCQEIRFLSSAKSAGKTISFQGQNYVVQQATADSFAGIDIVLASAGKEASALLAPEAVKQGATFIDNSSCFRMDKNVPLVVVGVNDTDLQAKGIIANPNCSTAQLMVALKPLHDYAKIKRLIVSTYQAVSGAGQQGIQDLNNNMTAFHQHQAYQPQKFSREIAYNVVPQIDTFCENGYTKEEMKLICETKKILHLDDNIPVSCTAVRVPVFVGHALSVDVEFEKEISLSVAQEILSAHQVIVAQEPDAFLTPRQICETNPVYVGRMRQDLAFSHGLAFWCVADNLRIGAALNAVRIAQKVLQLQQRKEQQ